MQESPIKKLRDTLGWNQATLAQAIARSWQSVQNYEAGKRVPTEVVEKLKTIAAQHGLADIALELSSDEWRVRRVFHPGETIISQTHKKTAAAPARTKAPSGNRETAHRMLDEVYDSGSPDALTAIFLNLDVVTKYLRLIRQVRAPAAGQKA